MRDEFVPGKLNTGQPSPELLDLNSCSIQDLLEIGGVEPDWAVRIVEARPYRNKMDLLSRMVVPIDVFHVISARVSIAKPDEAVKIAWPTPQSEAADSISVGNLEPVVLQMAAHGDSSSNFHEGLLDAPDAHPVLHH